MNLVLASLLLILFNGVELLFAVTLTTKLPIHVKARLIECKKSTTCDSLKVFSTDIKNLYDSTNFNSKVQGPELVQTCRRKLYITVSIDNEGKVSGDDEFLVVDSADDPNNNSTAPLLNPIVLKLRREQIQIVYPLHFQELVNGGIDKEVVSAVNKSNVVCERCNVRDYNDTFYEGNCCKLSINENNTLSRTFNQPSLFSYAIKRKKKSLGYNKNKEKEHKETNLLYRIKMLPCSAHHRNNKGDLSKPSTFFFEHDKNLMNDLAKPIVCPTYNQLSAEEVPSAKNHRKKVYQLRKMGQNQLTYGTRDSENANYFKHKIKSAEKSSLDVKFFGKNRLERSNKEGDTFRTRVNRERLKKVLERNRSNSMNCEEGRKKSTSHCLRSVSDLWYSIYSFQDPIIVQELTLQVFQKRDSSDGTTYWTDLTRGNVIRLGTYYPQAIDELPTIAISYSSTSDIKTKCVTNRCPIDPSSRYLLVPSHEDESFQEEAHPEAQGGPAEYLVVSRDEVSTDGRVCDQVDTTFEGLPQQSERCQQSQGLLLDQQPIDLWIRDMDLQVKGNRGQHFVENFGSVPSVPLFSVAKTFQGDFLALEYTSYFRSMLEVEVRADSNVLLRDGWNIQMQSISVDSFTPQRTVLEVLVVNTGLLSGTFRPLLVECNGDLPPDAIPEGPLVHILPLHRHIFKIVIEGVLPISSITCTVELRNTDKQRVASRQVIIQKQARCVCAFHCGCSCLLQDGSGLCIPLMQEEYAAAGYTGGLPRRAGIPAQVPLELEPLNILLTVLMILLLLGKFKVLLGFSSKSIHAYGLDYLKYSLELFICGMRGDKKRELLHRYGTEIFLNMFFFILYPMVTIWLMILSCCSCCIKNCEGRELGDEWDQLLPHSRRNSMEHEDTPGSSPYEFQNSGRDPNE